jgi:uncharacterized protein (TIGR03067 family)
MHSRALIILMTTLLVAADHPEEGAAQKDMKAIQGTWKIDTLAIDGNPAPATVVAMLTFVFKDDKLTITPGDPGEVNHTYRLDPSAKPASFDMTHADGKDKGKTQKGIYSLEGNSLKLCFGKPDQRPEEFTAKAKSGQALYVLKRENR